MKKVLQIMLLIVFIANPIVVQMNALQASSFGEEADYGNYGAGFVGKVYDDGNSIGYSIGGKYAFKIKQRSYQPWFQGKPPSISAGCGGISFTGGFMSLLNIDQIGDQLKDAGAAIAWGIILGLVTSLPSIKEVWDTINKWARMIQQLLANACNIGKMIGQGIANRSGLKAHAKTVEGAIHSNWIMSKLQTAQGETEGFISKYMGKLGEWADEDVTDAERGAVGFDLISGLLDTKTFAQTQASSLTKKYALDIEDVVVEKWDLTEAKAGSILKETTLNPIPAGLSGSELSEYQFKALIGFFAYNTAKTMHLTSSGAGTMKTLAGLIEGAMNNTLEQEEMQKLLKSINTAFDEKSSAYTHESPESAVGSMPWAIFYWARDGMGGSDFISDDVLNKIYIPTLLGIVNAPSNTNGSPGEKRVNLAGVHSTTLLDSTKWKDVLTSFGDFGKIADKQLACLTRDTTSLSTDCNSMLPIMNVDVKRWVYIYSQSSREDQEKVKASLKEVLTTSLFVALEERIKYECERLSSSGTLSLPTNPGSDPVGPAGDARSGEKEIESTCLELVTELNKIIRDELPKVSVKELPKEMEIINNKNIKRGLKISSQR